MCFKKLSTIGLPLFFRALLFVAFFLGSDTLNFKRLLELSLMQSQMAHFLLILNVVRCAIRKPRAKCIIRAASG
jgi:hypothetical protein